MSTKDKMTRCVVDVDAVVHEAVVASYSMDVKCGSAASDAGAPSSDAVIRDASSQLDLMSADNQWPTAGLCLWLTAPTVKKLNFQNPRWRSATILKTIKSRYLRNHFTDFD